jgi:LacI family transcriptional regulator
MFFNLVNSQSRRKNRPEMAVMPTTKDLAEAAGVSLATVDRVLNGRPGVRKETIEAVNMAIQRIGFERNHVAAILARQRGYRFGFVVPQPHGEFVGEILDRIHEANKAFRAERIEAEALKVNETDPHQTARFLAALDPNKFDGVAIMAPETPQIRDAIKRLEERGIKSIAFVSNQGGGREGDFVGIDNYAAGATAGRIMGRFCGSANGSIMVIGDSMKSRDSVERRLGFDHVINSAFPHLKVLPSLEFHGDPERARQIVANTVRSRPDLVGAYVASSEARVPIEALFASDGARKIVKIAHEKTDFTRTALLSDQLDAVVHQDPGHLVRSAIRTLWAKCDKRAVFESQERIRIEILIKDNL